MVASNERFGLDKRTSWLSTLSGFKFADVVTLRSLTVTVLFTICKFSDDVKTSKPFTSKPFVCRLFAVSLLLWRHQILNFDFYIILSHYLPSDLWLKQLRSPL